MNDVIRLCGLADVESGTARRVEAGGYCVSVVRIDDDVYALGDTCSHEDYSLSEGEVWPEDCTIECPKHGSTFDLRTGEPQTLPATKAVPVFVVRVEGDDIVMELP